MFERDLTGQDSPWLPAYGAVVNIDINTGNVLVERRYPDQTIAGFQIANDGTLFVETELRSDFLMWLKVPSNLFATMAEAVSE